MDTDTLAAALRLPDPECSWGTGQEHLCVKTERMCGASTELVRLGLRRAAAGQSALLVGVRSVLWPLVLAQLPEDAVRDHQRRRITFPNGGVLHLANSASSDNEVRGLRVDWLGIDDVDRVRDEHLHSALATKRPGADQCLVWTPPFYAVGPLTEMLRGLR